MSEELSGERVNGGLYGSLGVPNTVNHPLDLGPNHWGLAVHKNYGVLGQKRKKGGWKEV